MPDQSTDFQWLNEHPEELIKLYPGKWLAVVDNRVVAWGDDAPTVYERARAAYPDAEILLDVVERDVVDPV